MRGQPDGGGCAFPRRGCPLHPHPARPPHRLTISLMRVSHWVFSVRALNGPRALSRERESDGGSNRKQVATPGCRCSVKPLFIAAGIPFYFSVSRVTDFERDNDDRLKSCAPVGNLTKIKRRNNGRARGREKVTPAPKKVGPLKWRKNTRKSVNDHSEN